MIIGEIQKNSLKEQRLQFIRPHQQAFNVEPLYPLRLFEDFVMAVEGDCSLEASFDTPPNTFNFDKCFDKLNSGDS